MRASYRRGPRNRNDRGQSRLSYKQGQYVGTTAYSYVRDHLGSIREMFTGGGTVVARYDYDPYGRSTTIIGTAPTDMNFAGLYRHSKSNLDLAVFRAYDPELGRWLSRDPIAEKGGLNLYGYSSNIPILRTDVLGLESKPPVDPGEVSTGGAVISRAGEIWLASLYRHYYQEGLASCNKTPPSPPGQCCKCC